MVRVTSCFWLVIFALAEIGCADQIAAVDLGPSCQTSADCEGDFYCYKTACLPRPRCRVDGLKTDGEECDDGNNVNTDGCTNTCALARCGDGIVRNDLHLEHDQFENCEPEIGDPDLDCGDNCRLLPRGRSLISSDIGSCTLNDNHRLDCWGRFHNWATESRARFEQGLRFDPAQLLFWRGTSMQLNFLPRGFITTSRLLFYPFKRPGPGADQMVGVWLLEKGRLSTSRPDATSLHKALSMLTAGGLVVYGEFQGGRGELHNPDWIAHRMDYSPVRYLDWHTKIGCGVSPRGTVTCSSVFNTLVPKVDDDCQSTIPYNPNLRIDGLEGVVGVAVCGNVVCAYSDLGEVHCMGDTDAYRPIKHIEWRDSLDCNAESPCADPAFPICTAHDARGSEFGACVECALDSDCTDGICFEAHCYSGDDVSRLSRCHWNPPSLVEGLGEVVELAADTASFTARNRNGEVVRWGRIITGWVNGKPLRSLKAPSLVPLPAPARQLAQSHDTTCALLEDGSVACWGHRNGSESVEPHLIADLPPIGELGLADRYADHFCARPRRAELGAVHCWGSNDNYQLGVGHNEAVDGAVPVSVSFSDNPTQLGWP